MNTSSAKSRSRTGTRTDSTVCPKSLSASAAPSTVAATSRSTGPKPLHQPAYTKRTFVGTIEWDGAPEVAVLSTRTGELRKCQRQIANAPRHRSHMPEVARLTQPDARHRHASVRRLQRDNARVGCRATQGDRKVGTQAKWRRADSRLVRTKPGSDRHPSSARRRH